MQEINLFFDQAPVKIIGIRTGKKFAEGSEADCFKFLNEKYRGETIDKGTFPEPLQIIRLSAATDAQNKI
ncbi:hypothetical protein [Oceanobacillus oncorhynchi]|uniref:hypothetical protein n=1 Tax=Oceanobacillus oncorhynchi TaxID=545501 RepID=UPI001869244A|nr:hypothetical protein [Oceanobacillus oncorhynchi]